MIWIRSKEKNVLQFEIINNIDEICKKAYFCVLSGRVVIKYYNAHFQFLIKYAIIAWGCATEGFRILEL